jgi:hypothetical protein
MTGRRSERSTRSTEGQYRYFIAKVAQLRRKGQRVKLPKNALFAAIVIVIVAMILSEGVTEGYKILYGASLKNFVTFVEGVLALPLGAWQLHDSNKASRELLLQYRNQGNRFARNHIRRMELEGLGNATPAGRADCQGSAEPRGSRSRRKLLTRLSL